MIKLQIDNSFIKKTASNEAVFVQGKKLADSGNVSIVSKEWENIFYVVKAVAQENVKEQNFYMIFDARGAMYEYRCSCDSSRIWRGACKHVAAALFLLMGNRNRDYAAMVNDRAAEKFLLGLEASVKAERGALLASKAGADERMSLVPEIVLESGGVPFLELSVGGRRKYVVKNVGEFLTNVREASMASYGKNLSFIHHISNFDEESVKLITFLQTQHSLYNSALKTASSPYWEMYDYAFARRLPLWENALDAFFALREGTFVKANVNCEKTEALFTAEPAEYKYEIAASGNGIAVSGDTDVLIFPGFEHAYMYVNGAFHRVALSHGRQNQPAREPARRGFLKDNIQ